MLADLKSSAEGFVRAGASGKIVTRGHRLHALCGSGLGDPRPLPDEALRR
jgi:hypothetical protein